MVAWRAGTTTLFYSYLVPILNRLLTNSSPEVSFLASHLLSVAKRGLNTKRPTIVFFLGLTKPLP